MTAIDSPAGTDPSLALRRQYDLVRITALRTLKVRYRGTALGVLWSFANPILMTFLYTAIFGTAFASYYGSRNLYILSAFIGVSVVTYFLQTTGDALGTVVANGMLLNKIAMPREVFPIASVVANTFQQCCTTFPALLFLALLITHSPLRVLLAAVVLVAVVGMAAGFSLALSALYVFFRDLPHVWGIIGFVLWLTSPVFYPTALVPVTVRAYVDFNPIGLAMSTMRSVMVTRGPIPWSSIGLTLVVSLAIVVVGVAVFRALRDDFMDLL